MLWLAQVPDLTPGVPASGWAAAGILTGVLGWLMFIHLPAKDKQIKELIADFRSELADERKQFREALDIMARKINSKSGD
jgi:hypothetical protein